MSTWLKDQSPYVQRPHDSVLIIEGDCIIKSGPINISLSRDGSLFSAKQWVVERDGYYFKCTIQDGHDQNIHDLLLLVSKLPKEYLAGLEIVSESNETGLTLWTPEQLDVAVGSETYLNINTVNVYDNSFITLTHEIGHAIEQRIKHSFEPDILDKWGEYAEADGIEISSYGSRSNHEDLAEFSSVYAYSIKLGWEHILYRDSPQRFKLWTYCVSKVNTHYRQDTDLYNNIVRYTHFHTGLSTYQQYSNIEDLYEFHIECNIGVYDDSGGNVYMIILENDYTDQQNQMISNLLISNPYSSRTRFASNSNNVILESNIAFNVTTEEPIQYEINPIEPLTNYSVYVIAKDIYMNTSQLEYAGRGNINYPDAPTYDNFSVTYNSDSLTIDAHAVFRSTVAFRVLFILSSIDVGNSDTPWILMRNMVDDTSTSGWYTDIQQNNLLRKMYILSDTFFDTGNIEYTTANIDITFSHVLNVIEEANVISDRWGDYDPWIDRTKTLYLYTYAINTGKYANRETVLKTTIHKAHEPNANVDIIIMQPLSRDSGVEVNFVSRTSNIEYYIALFHTPSAQNGYDDFQIFGQLKKRLINVPTWGRGNVSDTNLNTITLNDYYESDPELDVGVEWNNKPIEPINPKTFFVYMMVRDPVTQQYSEISKREVKSGSAPRLIDIQGWFNSMYTQEGAVHTITISANIEEESNGTIHGALIVDDLGVDISGDLRDAMNNMDLVAQYLPNSIDNNLVTHMFDYAYANITALNSNIRSNIEIDTTYAVYFVMIDTYSNEKTQLVLTIASNASDYTRLVAPTFEPSDKMISELQVSDSGLNVIRFAAYPATITTTSTYAQITAQMNNYGHLWSPEDGPTELTGYFANIDSTLLTPFEYSGNYLVYAFGIRGDGTHELSYGVLAQTAREPKINNIRFYTNYSIFTQSIRSNTFIVTVKILVEEQSLANVYVVLFDQPQREDVVIRFFEGAEFDNQNAGRYVIAHSTKSYREEYEYTSTFTYIHTNALFYDSNVRIAGSQPIYAYAYVKNTEYGVYNEAHAAFANVDEIWHVPDYDESPLLDVKVIDNDHSFTVSSDFTIIMSSQIPHYVNFNLAMNYRVAAFTNQHSNVEDLISFFRDVDNSSYIFGNITNHLISGNITKPNGNIDVSADDVILTKAVTLSHLNSRIPVTWVTSYGHVDKYKFFDTENDVTLLKGRTYIFDQSLGWSPRIHFRTPQDIEFTEGVTYVVDDKKWNPPLTIEQFVELNDAFLAGTTRYMRFDVPNTPNLDRLIHRPVGLLSLYSGNIWFMDDLTATANIHTSTKTQSPHTDYYIYAFLEDDTPYRHNVVSTVQTRQTGAPPKIIFGEIELSVSLT
jgi:hypothetical protein